MRGPASRQLGGPLRPARYRSSRPNGGPTVQPAVQEIVNYGTGPFPVPSPGTPHCTDALTIVAPGRLFTQNYCEGKFYEIDTNIGQVANASLPAGLGVVGGLAGGNRRLFATIGFGTIAEFNPDTGVQLNSFPAPDLNGDGVPETIFGLGFDGSTSSPRRRAPLRRT